MRHPMSFAKTKAAVAATIDQTNAQRTALLQLAGAVNLHTALLSRGFLGRLKWLLQGK